MERLRESALPHYDISTPAKELTEILHGKPAMLVVMGGGRTRRSSAHVPIDDPALILEDSGKIRYRTSSYYGLKSDEDIPTASGARARVYAAATIADYFDNNSSLQFVTTGHKADVASPKNPAREEFYQGNPSSAIVMAEELLQIAKIRREQITILEEPTATVYEIMDVINHAAQKRQSGAVVQNVTFITNEYQIPRVQAFIEMFADVSGIEWFFRKHEAMLEAAPGNYLELFKGDWEQFLTSLASIQEVRLQAISAEKILPFRDRRWKQLIGILPEWQPWQNSIAGEEKGTQDVRNRVYTFNKSNFLKNIAVRHAQLQNAA